MTARLNEWGIGVFWAAIERWALKPENTERAIAYLERMIENVVATQEAAAAAGN